MDSLLPSIQVNLDHVLTAASPDGEQAERALDQLAFLLGAMGRCQDTAPPPPRAPDQPLRFTLRPLAHSIQEQGQEAMDALQLVQTMLWQIGETLHRQHLQPVTFHGTVHLVGRLGPHDLLPQPLQIPVSDLQFRVHESIVYDAHHRVAFPTLLDRLRLQNEADASLDDAVVTAALDANEPAKRRSRRPR